MKNIELPETNESEITGLKVLNRNSSYIYQWTKQKGMMLLADPTQWLIEQHTHTAKGSVCGSVAAQLPSKMLEHLKDASVETSGFRSNLLSHLQYANTGPVSLVR